MLDRDEWLDLARNLDWNWSFVEEREVFPELISGTPWLNYEQWKDWEEPYRTTYMEYVRGQAEKNFAVYAVRDAVGKTQDFQQLSSPWISALKLYGATFTLAEFAAVIGNLRGARFGRTSAWRTMATLGALDEIRHTEIPLMIMHDLVKWDPQFDWVHRFYHSNNWVALAARHMVDELFIGSNAIEFAVATNFVFETGFTNLQFIGLSTLAKGAGDHMFSEMTRSIQTDEARHAQIGPAVLARLVQEDREYAQNLLDKWFWRSWRLFAIVTGFSMDYLTPLTSRTQSFKEFMEEWILYQYLSSLKEFGLKKPWYWDLFIEELEAYHHLVYASAYSYRSTIWFNMPLPSPEEREWLAHKYPKYWPHLDAVWKRIDERWEACDPGLDMGVHGTSIIGFCDLCQIVLCGGTPENNTARVIHYMGQKYVFCSEPCQEIFLREPEKYRSHNNLVQRVLKGEAPGNLMAMLTQYFDLTFDTWGKDSFQGLYSWLNRSPKSAAPDKKEPRL